MLQVQHDGRTIWAFARIADLVPKMVVSRGPVTQNQFNMVLALVSDAVATRFELNREKARQAVRPILIKLIQPNGNPTPIRVRRVVVG